MPRTTSLILAAALALAAAPADARTERPLGWTAAQVYPTALRFLVVDEGVKIVEKDAEIGYVLFDLTDEKKVFRGALELIPVENDPPTVRLVLRIEDRPEYMEVGMLDRLERKLRDEHGPPPRQRVKPKKPEKPAEKPADGDKPAA